MNEYIIENEDFFISPTTLRRYLKDFGCRMVLEYRVWRCFSQDNMDKRVVWCKDFKEDLASGKIDLDQVIFMDEKIFTLDGPRVQVRYRPGIDVLPTRSITKHSKQVWVWAAISKEGPINIYIEQPKGQGSTKWTDLKADQVFKRCKEVFSATDKSGAPWDVHTEGPNKGSKITNQKGILEKYYPGYTHENAMEILIGDLREGVLDIWDRSKKKSAEARQAYADEKVPPPKDSHGRNLTGPLLKEIFDTKLTKGLDAAYKKKWLIKGKTKAYHDNSGPNKSQRMTGKPATSLKTCPNSPDLNVIEDFWNMLSMRCVRARGSVSPLSFNSSLSLFALSAAQSARPHALSQRQGSHCDQPGPGHRGRFLLQAQGCAPPVGHSGGAVAAHSHQDVGVLRRQA